MRPRSLPYTHWPRGDNGELIIGNTQESHLLAFVISDDHVMIGRVKRWRSETLKRIEIEKTRSPVDYQLIMDLATRAQFFRECLEEIERIR